MLLYACLAALCCSIHAFSCHTHAVVVWWLWCVVMAKSVLWMAGRGTPRGVWSEQLVSYLCACMPCGAVAHGLELLFA